MSGPLIVGIDPGLATGGLVLIRVGRTNRDDEVLEVLSLVDPKTNIDADRQLSRQIVEKEGRVWGDRQFVEAALRSNRWSERALEEILLWQEKYGPIEKIAIESFVDQPSKAKKIVRLRWQTPLLIGVFQAALERAGWRVENEGIVYQNAGTVLRQWQTEIALLKKANQKSRASRADGVIVKGDAKITNDHLRKALVHGLALAIRIRENKKSEKEL